MKIIVEKENYKRCEEFACNMWANEKTPSKYNSGMLNTKNDPYKTERVGALGEMAFAIYMNLVPDFNYCKYGKDVDFTINDKKIDIKTAAKFPTYEATLIRCMNEYGKYIKPKCDIYVSAYIERETLKEMAEIEIVGWHKLSEILEQQPVRARRRDASHWNYEMKFCDAKPIETLKEYLNG